MTPVMKVRELVPSYAKIEVGDPRPDQTGQVRLTSSADVATLIRPVIGENAIDESCWAIYVNGANRLLAIYRISEGGPTEAGVYPAKVFRGAVLVNAAAVILVHNHPSGETFASAPDRAVTEELVRAGEYMRIPVVDHVILGAAAHYSFADRGLIEEYKRRVKP